MAFNVRGLQEWQAVSAAEQEWLEEPRPPEPLQHRYRPAYIPSAILSTKCTGRCDDGVNGRAQAGGKRGVAELQLAVEQIPEPVGPGPPGGG
jgi:hypothetical protein